MTNEELQRLLDENNRSDPAWTGLDCILAREVLALRQERDAAFAAGFEAARQDAEDIARKVNDAAVKWASTYLKEWDGETDSSIIANKIHTLTPPDASEALAARDRKMRAEGMRKAAEICEFVRKRIAFGPMPEGARFDYEQAIRAAADKEEQGDE